MTPERSYSVEIVHSGETPYNKHRSYQGRAIVFFFMRAIYG